MMAEGGGPRRRRQNPQSPPATAEAGGSPGNVSNLIQGAISIAKTLAAVVPALAVLFVMLDAAYSDYITAYIANKIYRLETRPAEFAESDWMMIRDAKKRLATGVLASLKEKFDQVDNEIKTLGALTKKIDTVYQTNVSFTDQKRTETIKFLAESGQSVIVHIIGANQSAIDSQQILLYICINAVDCTNPKKTAHIPFTFNLTSLVTAYSLKASGASTVAELSGELDDNRTGPERENNIYLLNFRWEGDPVELLVVVAVSMPGVEYKEYK
jgi:hypothetical protein